LKKVLIPPFTLQPLVENAIRHAFSKNKKGKVWISGFSENEKMVLITEDNGKGIPADLICMLGNKTVDSAEGTGTGLWNIKKRITEIYGQEGDFRIESEPEKGTKVTIILPLAQHKESEENAEGIYC
jgi:two-component system, LytTR family, sensor histidine kinase LytS